MKTYFIAGGAGFIGSHLARSITKSDLRARIIIYDNFSSGRMWHLEELKGKRNVKIIKGDIKETGLLTKSMKGADIVYHFASNPDIAKAMKQPDVDFWEGTYLTNNVLESMRKNSISRLLYASGSGIYGHTGLKRIHENYAPLLPISPYGASKLSCEALICAYCHMFNIDSSAFRFANVVGPNQTHGVGYDFIKKIMINPNHMQILGDGKQSKSYIYIDDIVKAMRLVENKRIRGFSYFNVATLDYITVTEIANIVRNIMGVLNIKYVYTGGDRGWKGDVPVVRFNTEKIRKLGWKNRYSSREAIYKSVESMYKNAKLNKFNWQ